MWISNFRKTTITQLNKIKRKLMNKIDTRAHSDITNTTRGTHGIEKRHIVCVCVCLWVFVINVNCE